MNGLQDYDYELPADLIAQEPSPERDRSRLLVVHRGSRAWEHRSFHELPEYMRPGDLMVLNETRVFPARLRARRPTGGRVEVFLLERQASGRAWKALGRPARALRPGTECRLDGDSVTVHPIAREADKIIVEFRRGNRVLEADELLEVCERAGEVPLPPYIRRAEADRRRPADRERYQTVYAREVGSVAAPTAGLHFTPELLERIAGAGVGLARVTLHVGYGTFKPLTEESFESPALHEERVEVGVGAGEAILAAHEERRRIIAVGTTSARAVESFLRSGTLPFSQKTDLFIKPGYGFLGVNVLVTNFHLPRSSLLLLVCALAGREVVLEAYREAVRQRYRFYSYGDAMLIL